MATLLLACGLCACGGGGDAQEEGKVSAALIEFRIHGLGASEAFRVEISSPEVLAKVQAQLALPLAERTLFAIGAIEAGDGGVNAPWSWHFTGVRLTEMAIELCDGTPSLVEEDLAYWLTSVRTFCPWGSYVHAQVR